METPENDCPDLITMAQETCLQFERIAEKIQQISDRYCKIAQNLETTFLERKTSNDLRKIQY
jgi:uncharacterized protein Yka (UPF0111/DUF47 family)